MRLTTTSALLLLVLTLALTGCAPGEEQPAAETAAEGQDIVAWLNGEPITREEVDGFIKADLIQMETQIYERRRGILEQLVSKKLADKEAELRGITSNEYYQLEVASKVEEPTDEQARAFYDQNKNRYQDFQTKSYEELADAIKQNLKNLKANSIQRQLVDDLKKKAGFRLVLEPPRVDVPIPAGEPEKGAGEGAAVTIVEFSDYQCGYCRRAHPELKQLMEEYGDRVRFVYRDFPLAKHDKARPAAVAARCAGDQGKYWEYNEDLWTQSGSLDRTNLVARAEKLGLDLTAFNTCLDSGSKDEAIETAFQEGAALGIAGTPTTFVNGRMLVGVIPYATLKALVDEELDRAKPLPVS